MTPSCEAEKEDQRYFNSPPHKKNHIATTMINTVFFKISTHILTKRMTDGFPTFCILCVISTHILTKRMTSMGYKKKQVSIFQLTSSRRGWLYWWRFKTGTQHFNSHPHEEDDLSMIYSSSTNEHFNSHPHEEDDYFLKLSHNHRNISTHILTKRMTFNGIQLFRIRSISTHILTKRMTDKSHNRSLVFIISTHILTKRMT